MVKITVKDVAKKADVSTATVSRVINGDYPVSDEVRERVLSVIKELNYIPNAVARSLKVKKTNTIGMVVPDISNPYFMKMAKGIEVVVSNSGYSLLMGSSHDNIENELELLELFEERRVEAIVLATCQNEKDNVEDFLQKGVNIVLVDRNIEGIKTSSIILNNFEASYSITEKLIRKGHKEIAIINGNPNIYTEKERYEGFLKAVKDNNIILKDELILRNSISKENAFEGVIKLLKNKDKSPTAIYCTNHYLQEGVLLGIKKFNMRVPEDISLVCFGESSIHKLINPKITSVSYDSYRLGIKCGDIVLDKINRNLKNEEIEYIVDVEIKEGNSIKEIV
ncbi:substrate-binding domain-containing protein [Clostridium malenominatum]|uniref:Substrate-binding domain-containing protein n=1 Tax=Clostridium malenominatum TaxID=1539 RepID=A0ABN1IQC0_9CLOT